MRGKLIIAATLFALAPASATWASESAATHESAAAPDVAGQQRAMADLAFLKGRWVGKNRTELPGGREVVSRSVDVIASKLDGLLLTIEGFGWSSGAPAKSAPESSNLGIVYYDDRDRVYRVDAHHGGTKMTGSGELVAPGQFRWQTSLEQTVVRFEASSTGPDSWTETGEISRDGGATWISRFEIDFVREEQD